MMEPRSARCRRTCATACARFVAASASSSAADIVPFWSAAVAAASVEATSAALAATIWLRVLAREAAMPVDEDTSPTALASLICMRSELEAAASSTTAPTLSGCSTVVPASYTSDTRQLSVQLPSKGSQLEKGTTPILPSDVSRDVAPPLPPPLLVPPPVGAPALPDGGTACCCGR